MSQITIRGDADPPPPETPLTTPRGYSAPVSSAFPPPPPPPPHPPPGSTPGPETSFAHSGARCALCNLRAISQQFMQCPHAACNHCLRALSKSPAFFPEGWEGCAGGWFSCPVCARKITRLGKLHRNWFSLKWTYRYVHGGAAFVVWRWTPLTRRYGWTRGLGCLGEVMSAGLPP